MPFTSGLSTIVFPTDEPAPVTRFRTPGGRPASSKISTSFTAVIGAEDAGLNTSVLPHMRAGAIFHAGMASGKFQGVMMATTPKGRLIV